MLATVLLPLACLAGESQAPAVPKGQTGFELGDYGPFLGTALQVAKGDVVSRGLVVRLADDAAVCFDTETMRMACAWSGGWIAGAGLPQMWTQHRGKFPRPVGEIAVASGPGPGWSADGGFADPRPTKDKPLPRELARWRGHHRHGRQVVLAYEVAGAGILELPSLHRSTPLTAFGRTLRIEAHAAPLHLLVATLAEGAGSAPEAPVATLSAGAVTVAALAQGAPAGSSWTSTGGRLVLRLPPATAPATLRVLVARVAAADAPRLAQAAPEPLADPLAMTAGGPSLWAQPVETAATMGEDSGPWAVDVLAIPEANPWRSWMRIGGFDFFADGKRAALCTGNGDVWIVDGLGARPGALSWRRFATGLHQPLGLKIVDGVVHTVGRDQLTRLHDRDGDGEADWYENLNNGHGLTTSYHELCFDLQVDQRGDFFFAKSGHEQASPSNENCCLVRVAKDGSSYEIFARGLRTPNGLGITPDGRIIAGDNQGQWTPGSPVRIVERGGYYGFVAPGAKPSEEPKPPLLWIPHKLDRSCGGQAWIADERWGPFKDCIAHTSYGHCALYVVLIDRGNPAQGAIVQLPPTFPTGVMRARFHPGDGQLHLAGMKGWDSRATAAGGFYRIRRTAAPVRLPVAWRCLPGAIEVTLAEPLEKSAAESAANWSCEVFNVVRSSGYGSPEWSVADPKKKGRDPLPVAAAALQGDGRTVRVELPGLRPVTNLVLKAKLVGADGQPVAFELCATIHAVPK